MDKFNKILYKSIRSTIAENKEFTEEVSNVIADNIKTELYSDIISHILEVVLKNNSQVKLESIIKVKLESSLEKDIHNKVVTEIKLELDKAITKIIQGELKRRGYNYDNLVEISDHLSIDNPMLYGYIEGLEKALSIIRNI